MNSIIGKTKHIFISFYKLLNAGFCFILCHEWLLDVLNRNVENTIIWIVFICYCELNKYQATFYDLLQKSIYF